MISFFYSGRDLTVSVSGYLVSGLSKVAFEFKHSGNVNEKAELMDKCIEDLKSFYNKMNEEYELDSHWYLSFRNVPMEKAIPPYEKALRDTISSKRERLIAMVKGMRKAPKTELIGMIRDVLR